MRKVYSANITCHTSWASYKLNNIPPWHDAWCNNLISCSSNVKFQENFLESIYSLNEYILLTHGLPLLNAILVNLNLGRPCWMIFPFIRGKHWGRFYQDLDDFFVVFFQCKSAKCSINHLTYTLHGYFYHLTWDNLWEVGSVPSNITQTSKQKSVNIFWQSGQG